ncbi:mitochondral 37s ribosomal protein [Ophiostoma piceae UAMH 11346]|uniref:Small ribosomal subunit protein mS33 n=1 Tax=Ophiostoma piceae (strain UAMH 11346) TaxID=1262450 RepID=S3CLN4_OPHP1|nr:mitochondral 37s ribosomal protein [Ophiostoma piceae UAMH 11346]
MSVPRTRLLDLMKVQCNVFATSYNPEGIRMGNKILRQRLRGAAMASYYPKRAVTFRDLKDTFAPDLHFMNWEDIDRLEHLDGVRSRGKGSAKRKAEAGKKKK